MQGLGILLGVTPTIGETGQERQRIPLQRVLLHKECQNSERSSSVTKSVNLTTYEHPGSGPREEHYSHRLCQKEEIGIHRGEPLLTRNINNVRTRRPWAGLGARSILAV